MYGRAKDVVDTYHSCRILDAGTRSVATLIIAIAIGPDIIGVRRR